VRISQYFDNEQAALEYRNAKLVDGDARFESAFLRSSGSYGLVYWSTTKDGKDEEFQP
jgi:hypothetical protein